MTKLADEARRTVFFDLTNSTESKQEMSRCNPDEVKFTLALVKCIKLICCQDKSFKPLTGKIAIVTPYKAQVQALKNAFGPWLRSISSQLSDVEINTVDAF